VTQGVPDPFKLFSRSCTITVGTVQIQNVGLTTGLDVWFKVKRTLQAKEPSTADLKIWNLSDATRAVIESYTQSGVASPAAAPGSKLGGLQAIVPVKIEAGYVGNTSTLFLGEMRSAQTVADESDLVTELNTGDGDEAKLLARSSASFGAGANALIVAKKLLADMGCGVGNIATVSSILQAAPLFAGGYVLKGNCMSHLSDLALSCGLEVSIQGGVAQWTTLGQPLGGQAYNLNADTGLIGSPTVDTKGVLNATCQLLPGINPGDPIVLSAKYVKGTFRVTSIETTGGTWAGQPWEHSIEAKRVGLAP
jgi:hypothetical protein